MKIRGVKGGEPIPPNRPKHKDAEETRIAKAALAGTRAGKRNFSGTPVQDPRTAAIARIILQHKPA